MFDAPSRREFVESLGNYRLLNNVYKIECENIPQGGVRCVLLHAVTLSRA